jgi:NtrC-family two-component system sensor histidine kinase KinB
LSEVYRYEHQAASYEIERRDIVPLIKACVENIARQAQFRAISVHTHFAQNTCKLDIDPLGFGRVVQNLLDNAVKFSEENGSIHVRMLVHDGKAIIEVEDNGVGISAKEQASLFRRFGQGRHGQKIGTGSGLGLYLCKQIIDAHHGEIQCESVEHVGSTFRLVLPNAMLEQTPDLTCTNTSLELTSDLACTNTSLELTSDLACTNATSEHGIRSRVD